MLLFVVGCVDVLMCCDADASWRGLFMSFSWNKTKTHDLLFNITRICREESAHTIATDKADQRHLRRHRLHMPMNQNLKT